MKIIPNFITPNQGYHHDHEHFFQSFLVGNVRVFDVETIAFKGLKKCFYLPSFFDNKK